MYNKILISRTDNIGDVMLTLPLAGFLKSKFPNSTIAFLGKSYTLPIITKSKFIDEAYDWEEIKKDSDGLKAINADCIIHVYPNKEVAKQALKAKIPVRIGTGHRLFHLTTCNKIVRFSRKKSDLHEAQLNFKLLKPFGITNIPELTELHQYYGWVRNDSDKFKNILKANKFNLIFHMKSKGSAKEWAPDNYLDLAKALPESSFQILITGTPQEGKLINFENSELFNLPIVNDITGKFTLPEFIDFIGHCDGLLACSTGPLHIAAASGIKCLGLYPSTRPTHAGRWGPIGMQADHIEENASTHNKYLSSIDVQMVKTKLLNFLL